MIVYVHHVQTAIETPRASLTCGVIAISQRSGNGTRRKRRRKKRKMMMRVMMRTMSNDTLVSSPSLAVLSADSLAAGKESSG